MSRPVLQFTRLTNASRLPDRFLACQVREFYESGLDGQARLFVIVEIVRPWLAASQIGQALIQAFLAGYHDATTSDDLKQVEAGLKRVNETLVHLTQQGETEWVGHLHALFALEKSGAIHVAQTGRAGAVLVRDDAVSRITELEGAQSAATANHTFGTITSGELAPGDALVIGSGELFRTLGNDLIADSLKESTAAEAIQRFARILRQHQTRSAAGIIVRAYDARTLADQPLLADPEVIYLDEQPIETLGSSLRTFGRRLGRFALASGHQLNRAGQAVAKSVRTTVAPRSKELFQSGQQHLGRAVSDLKTKHLPSLVAAAKPLLARAGEATKRAATASVEQAKKFAQQSSSSADEPKKANISIPSSLSALSPDAGLIGKDLYTVRHYTQQTKSASSRSLLSGWQLPNLRWPSRLPNIGSLTHPKYRPRLYAGLAGVLLLILIINVSLLHARQQRSENSAAALSAVTALRSRYDDVKLKLAIKSDPSVSHDLIEILKELDQLVTNRVVTTSATALQHDVQDTLDGLTKSTRVRDPKLIATFDHAKGLARLGSDLITAQDSSNKLLASPIAGQLIDDGSALPAGEQATALVRLDQADEVMALSDRASLYAITKPGELPQAVSLTGGSWETALAIASFFNNLYLLDPTGNQIWKHASAEGDKYAGGTKFITDGTNVSNGLSLAVDGSIYVLTRDSSILKLTQGKKDTFTIKDLPTDVTITDVRAIWTNSDTSSIYVLTKTSIIELAKTGSYSRRYISDQFTDLAAFVVDPSAKQAWVLNGDQVFELNLTGA